LRTWFAIKAECDHRDIIFMSTPQNRSDLDLLLEVGIPAIKVGSDDFTNLPMLRSFAQEKLPLILSCGMADMGEVYRSLETVGALDEHPVVLLLCTSQYPTPPADANLRKLTTLQAAFPMLPVGFSDHTIGPLASSLAAALGACMFEKHFTMDKTLPGPDHWFSEGPEELGIWVTSIHTAKAMLGEAVLRPTQAETAMRKLARPSLQFAMSPGVSSSTNPTSGCGARARVCLRKCSSLHWARPPVVTFSPESLCIWGILLNEPRRKALG
jgi:N,N'-diacetyllegionaminate synthase